MLPDAEVIKIMDEILQDLGNFWEKVLIIRHWRICDKDQPQKVVRCYGGTIRRP
jgi:hypothetical protein